MDEHTFTIEEGDRQMIVLALAQLSHTRPGWLYALTEIAKRFRAEAMFESFRTTSSDLKREDVNALYIMSGRENTSKI